MWPGPDDKTWFDRGSLIGSLVAAMYRVCRDGTSDACDQEMLVVFVSSVINDLLTDSF